MIFLLATLYLVKTLLLQHVTRQIMSAQRDSVTTELYSTVMVYQIVQVVAMNPLDVVCSHILLVTETRIKLMV